MSPNELPLSLLNDTLIANYAAQDYELYSHQESILILYFDTQS